DHAIGRIDEEAHVTELAEHQLPARCQRLHHGIAQHRPADQERLAQRAPPPPPAAAAGAFDLTPSITPSLTPSHLAVSGPTYSANACERGRDRGAQAFTPPARVL